MSIRSLPKAFHITLATLSFLIYPLLNGHAAQVATGAGPYSDWQHEAVTYILTTKEGAHLPDSALVEHFPLLLRLNSTTFDFSEANSNGADVRFSSESGDPLSYQIESWDAEEGAATIWIRIPRIVGNRRQPFTMHWGHPDASSESNGQAVFNASNGYVSVWHMGEHKSDAVGSLEARDTGTTSAVGIIGNCRSFSQGNGMNCGEEIVNLPVGAQSNSTSAWIRAESTNARVVGWGNEERNGKVVMIVAGPPHMRMDCYFSGANVDGEQALEMSKWVHVVHTYEEGEARLYVNGVLDDVNRSRGNALNVKSPGRLYIGGWYNNFDFEGELDEVRISNVTRSPHWVKLTYANQNPMQTLVGHPIQAGTGLSTSTLQLVIEEGELATVTAEAARAQKVFWTLESDDTEEVLAVDRFSVTLDAGRVVGDQRRVLRFHAVYPDQVKTIDVPVTIVESIPEPQVTLSAPSNWDGRETIELVPQIGNLAALGDAGVADMEFNWKTSGIAVIRLSSGDRLILDRAQNSGELVVTVSVSNGGAVSIATASIRVDEPKTDPWIHRVPGDREMPEDHQFYARGPGNEGTLYCTGVLQEPADELFLRLYANGTRIQTLTQRPGDSKTYAFSAKLKPGLIKYSIEFGSIARGEELVLHRASDILCGDAYLIEGQSNALATDTREQSPLQTHEWVRSYARPRFQVPQGRSNLWSSPVWKATKEHKSELGWWGMELAKNLVESQGVPIFMINAAAGGTRIDQHQRNADFPEDLDTIYGRMLWRVTQARLTHGIRAVLWHQGESDQGAAGPDGDYGWKTYQQYFVDMSAGWKQDFPNLQHYYVFQIWPNSCSMGSGHGDMLRERQRTLPALYSNMDVLSTLGVQPPGGCHFPLIGWAKFADMVQPLIERDLYGMESPVSLTPPNVQRAYYSTKARDELALEFDQAVVWNSALCSEFYLDGLAERVTAGSVSKNVLTLKLNSASAASRITYLKEMSWSQDRLLIGANKLAALSFCDLPIESAP